MQSNGRAVELEGKRGAKSKGRKESQILVELFYLAVTLDVYWSSDPL